MKKREERRFQIFGHIVMCIMSFTVILPMLLLFMSSVTDDATLIKYGYNLFPREFSMYAYSYVFRTGNAVLKAYGMSFLLTAIGVTASLTITTTLAYTLSQRNLFGRKVLTFYVFFTMLFNGGLVPTYISYTNVFRIKDTFFALLVPNLLTCGMYILLMKSYFMTSIPEELYEAARIDGANALQVFSKIAVPLAKPIITTIGLFAGIGYWNDWQNGFVYIVRKPELYTIQNLLNRMVQNIQYLSQASTTSADAESGLAAIPTVSIRMAMAVLGVLPIILIYPFIQKNFVKGITLGGVKA